MDKRRKREHRVLLVLVSLFVLLLIGTMTAIGTFVVQGVFHQKEGSAALPEPGYARLESTRTVAWDESGEVLDLSGIVDEVMPSIVAITNMTTTKYYNFFGSYERDSEGRGSGIIFEETEKELLIMTNYHVVENSKSLQITFENGTIVEGGIKGTNSSSDLAVVAVPLSELEEETRETIRVARLGNSEACRVGQMVLAIGNALGYGQSLTVGYISAKDRPVLVDNREMVLLQTDAAINPGNSGGALLNMQGEVIGINSVKYLDEKVERMGYAIPMEKALPIIESLKGREDVGEEERGYLGIRYEEVSEDLNQFYQFPYGIYVTEVLQGSAADKAGIYVRDIITVVNGIEVMDKNTMQDCMKGHRIGEEITLMIERYYRGRYHEIELTVTLEGLPEE